MTYDVNQPSSNPGTNNEVKVQSLLIARWLLIQQRISNDLDFNRSWTEYAKGFGSPQKNFYLGNEPVSQLTDTRPHSLRIELLIGGAWYSGEYWRFSVSSGASGYSLSVSGFSGDLKDALSPQNGKMFRTYDAPIIGCETFPLSSGWWLEMPTPPCSSKQPPFNPIANLNAPFGPPSPVTIHWSAVDPDPGPGPTPGPGPGPSSGGPSNCIEQSRMLIRPID